MRTTLSILFTGASLALWAQNSNVVNAYNYMKDGDLAKAAEYIEPAIGHEATMGKEKTWRYRGDIYKLIALGQDANLKAQFPDALAKAVDSYAKANELDTKGEYRKENLTAMRSLQAEALNSGNDAFTAKDYDKAIALYAESERIAKSFNEVDSNAVFNSALAYETKGDAAGAIKRYQECLAMGYNKAEVYRYLASLQRKQGDLNGAITTTQAGRKAHPNEKELMLDEVAFLLEAGRSEEAEVSTKAAIEKDPNNAVLYSVLGSLYDAKANPKEGKAPAEAEMMKWYDLAEQAYKTSIEKDPKFFDSYFNIGVLYNNRAAYIYDKIADIKDDNKYNQEKKAADDIYLKAVPYFEKAHELRPDDKPTMQQLKKLYAKTSDTAKYNEMKKLLGE